MSEKRTNHGSRFTASTIIFPLMLFLLAFGCAGPNKRVAKKMDELRVQWQTNLAYQSHLPDKHLDWPTAMNLVLENNLKLIAARMEVTNSQEQVRQVWRDLVPTLNFRAGITKSIKNLGALTADDVTLSADSFFNIPGVVNFGARWYAAQLYLLRSEVAYKLAEREQALELYRLFYGSIENEEEEKRLQSQRASAGAMEQIDPFTGRLMITEMQSRELGHTRDLKTFQDAASDVLGSRQFHWIFTTNGLPELNYQHDPLPLNDTNRVAQLQMKLLAIELEAARATLLGIKLRYWPELNIFVSSPAIFQQVGGQTVWWKADNVTMSADVFWQIDTRGYITRMLKQTRRQQQLQNAHMRDQSLALINRLAFTQNLIQSVQQQLARVDSQLELLLAVPPAQNYFAIEKHALDYHSLTAQQLRLRRELAELNGLFWFVDEDAWRGQMTRFPGKVQLN
jgi:hypothetical protein